MKTLTVLARDLQIGDIVLLPRGGRVVRGVMTGLTLTSVALEVPLNEDALAVFDPWQLVTVRRA